MSATDHGNSDEILKCLNLDNDKIIANDNHPEKRLDRIFSTNGYNNDDLPEEEKKRLEDIIEENKAEEIEEVIFECLNCGSWVDSWK